jgi:hypothetical protein
LALRQSQAQCSVRRHANFANRNAREMKSRTAALASAYGAACVAAGGSIGLAISLTYAVEIVIDQTAGSFSHLAFSALGAMALVVFGGLWGMVFGGLLIAVFALPTSLLLIIYAERSNCRSWWFYGMCGAGNGSALSTLYFFMLHPIIESQTSAPSVDMKLLAAIAVCGGAGLLGGLVYKAVAAGPSGSEIPAVQSSEARR